MGSLPPNVLDIRDLAIAIDRDGQERSILRGVNLAVPAGRAVGLVGESGSGKSVTARAVMGHRPRRSRITGSVVAAGTDPFTATRRELRSMRAHDVAMVYQDPRAALNPYRRIGDFMIETLDEGSRAERQARAVAALAEVGVPNGPVRLRQYPHELSGGLLQRVVIAAAILQAPRLILADEPTTALDVTTQSEVMAVLKELQVERGLGMLFISHDLDLAAAVTDELCVMYAGRVLEQGPTRSVHDDPLHPYTYALLAARPSLTDVHRLRTIPTRSADERESSACVFADRCPFALARCRTEVPVVEEVAPGRRVACHRSSELAGRLAEGWDEVMS